MRICRCASVSAVSAAARVKLRSAAPGAPGALERACQPCDDPSLRESFHAVRMADRTIANLQGLCRPLEPTTIFVINLDEDRERLDHIDRQLAALGMRYRRFPAYRGHALPDWLRGQFVDAGGTPHSPMTAGEIGCYASHLGVYRTIVEERIAGPIMVLEDDAAIGEAFAEVVAALDRLPSDWGIVRCSSTPKAAFVPVGNLTPHIEVVQYWRIPMNTTCYLITRTAAERFLAAMSKRTRPLDKDLRRFWEVDLKTYGLVPPPIRARGGASSIDSLGEREARDGPRFPEHPQRLKLMAARLKTFGPWLSIRCIRAELAMHRTRRSGGERWPVSVLRVGRR